jgi:uncharacterized membrane protein (UPF0127 family)
MRVVNLRTGAILAERVGRADTFFARARGLLGRSALEPGEGLWIDRCSSIHMFFMRFPIDALFVDRETRVTRLAADLRPWRVAFGGSGACAVLEIEMGAIEASGTQIGDALRLVG